MVVFSLATVTEWLGALKSAQLHRVAISIGAKCSGTKPELKRAIVDHLRQSALFTTHRKPDKILSLVSIDMGVRNMAYAHLTAKSIEHQVGSSIYPGYGKPRLQAWQKLVISSPSSLNKDDVGVERGLEKTRSADLDVSAKVARKRLSRGNTDAYSPQIYAEHAVTFINSIITRHNPTHIIIERQRFRSGGSSAVQDWSIRVGVLEGMLYAVIQSLRVKNDTQVHIEGILTQKVNRYWLGPSFSTDNKHDSKLTTSITGAAAKKAKVDLVGEILSGAKGVVQSLNFEVDTSAVPTVDAFLSRLRKESANTKKASVADLTKLDDLADSLLQGLSWIDWQTNKAKISALGPAALSTILLEEK